MAAEFLTRLARKPLTAMLELVPFGVAVGLSKRLLAAQGFGAGGTVGISGETGVFRLIGSDKPVLFDVGGHIGEYTQAFLTAFPGGRSYVFEPSAHHLELLKAKLGGDQRATILPFGLGTETAELPLYKHSDVSGLASLSQRRLDHRNIKMDLVETVRIRKLDDVFGELGIARIDLLKIDVEGHELAVLEGAKATLERGAVKLVQFEFGGCNLDTRTNLQDFFYFFKAHGFAIAVVSPSGRLRKLKRYTEFFEHYRTTNFVAAPVATLAGG